MARPSPSELVRWRRRLRRVPPRVRRWARPWVLRWTLRWAVRWVVLGALAGLLAGLASAAFLVALDRVTTERIDHPWLLFLLPAGGVAVGLAQERLAGRAALGSQLILDEIHDPRAWVPRRMAPLVLGGTVLSHLLGGSVGREGAAIQMSGSINDGVARLLGLRRSERRVLLMAAIAGGFGSAFGVPWAGFVFALEVQANTRHRVRAALPALVASGVGDRVVHLLGVHHTPVPAVEMPAWTPGLLAGVLVAAVGMGLVAWAFVAASHGLTRTLRRLLPRPPVRAAIGGVAVVALVAAVDDRAYLGLSVPLVTEALAGGSQLAAGAFALKFLFTVVTLSSGFPGGEVTPLIVIGATLGAALDPAVGVSPALLAAVGFVAVFAAAANAPLACTVMATELFGPGAVPLFALACLVSHACSPIGGIYGLPRPSIRNAR